MAGVWRIGLPEVADGRKAPNSVEYVGSGGCTWRLLLPGAPEEDPGCVLDEVGGWVCTCMELMGGGML
jgi:hypothetical protein